MCETCSRQHLVMTVLCCELSWPLCHSLLRSEWCQAMAVCVTGFCQYLHAMANMNGVQCDRPRAGRVEEEVRQARAVELIAQKRLLDLHMRSQVPSFCNCPHAVTVTCLTVPAHSRMLLPACTPQTLLLALSQQQCSLVQKPLASSTLRKTC